MLLLLALASAFHFFQAEPLTVVSGASGTGKSSLVLAGLLPGLRAKGWHILPPVQPGKDPMQGLNERELEAVLRQEGRAALVIDQYGELVMHSMSQEERSTFEQQLAAWLILQMGIGCFC